jgi:MYXO-CTERM domain-containing protein
MVFIPVPTPPPPSPRAHELAASLAQEIEEFGRRFPDTNPTDIRQALHLVARQTRAAPVPAFAVSLGLGLVLLVAAVGFMLFRNAGSEGGPPPIMIMLVVGLLVMGLLAVVVRRK